ncbi:MAG: molybdopterin-binding domain-containing protein [Rhodocyclaceae bacterium]|nr:MAG: molybdopterin-binding domain-containing protein [Rhodocyclaceae bacterium]TND00773.1 MAG: molybdopterin-binding domain-containing protein [Rhodocyclaceae bacterium]
MTGIGAIIIGDEITRGKREDKHFAKLIELLAARGLVLDWALHIGDDRERLTETLRRTLASEDIVFSFGGIGNTPDDHTRQAAAAAAGVDLVLHPDAEREIKARFAELKFELTEMQLALGNLPKGSRIIPNPFNRIPGFSLGDHHFVPGFPQMAWPMIEWVLDSYYSWRFNANPTDEAAILVWKGSEGALIPLMRHVEADFPGVKVFSLPFLGSKEIQRHIELGVRGAPELVPAAMAAIRRGVAELGYSIDEK